MALGEIGGKRRQPENGNGLEAGKRVLATLNGVSGCLWVIRCRVDIGLAAHRLTGGCRLAASRRRLRERRCGSNLRGS